MGLIEFGILCIIVTVVCFVLTYVVRYFEGPEVFIKAIWGVGIAIVLIAFLRAVVGGSDIQIPSFGGHKSNLIHK